MNFGTAETNKKNEIYSDSTADTLTTAVLFVHRSLCPSTNYNRNSSHENCGAEHISFCEHEKKAVKLTKSIPFEDSALEAAEVD